MSSLHRRRIAFTSPAPYGEFLRSRLEAAGAIPVWIPTIKTQFSDRTRENVRQAIAQVLSQSSGIAFTSRNGIRAVADELRQMDLPELQTPFLLGALGRDAELLSSLEGLIHHPHCQVVCPAIATPQALVTALGPGQGRTLLCPVPEVIGVPEPEVVPNFLSALAQQGWRPLRVKAYETMCASPDCISSMVQKQADEKVEAIIFTSTAEAMGFVASCQALGIDPQNWLQDLVIAVHGPVTAQGAQSLGLEVSVMSQDSSSFAGLLQALQGYWGT